jgi:hypothetical protein
MVPPLHAHVVTGHLYQVKAAPKALSPLLSRLPADKLLAVELVKGLYFQWKGPMETLDKAGKAFLGLEALLGGSGFQVDGNIWRRQVGARWMAVFSVCCVPCSGSTAALSRTQAHTCRDTHHVIGDLLL